MTKISIIIPCYNVEKYLRRCLDSVLSQTFCDWEAICVDDGSPDECGKILDQYAQNDSRFKIIHQENKGASVARNNGLAEAKGDWICFVDSDDIIHPQMLEIVYNKAISNNVDMVHYKYQEFKTNDVDCIAGRCTKDYKGIKAQCEFFRATKAHGGIISIHYIIKYIFSVFF